jgi:hypothetical protein
MAVVLALWMVDSLMNAMLNPVFVLALGGLAGLVGAPVRSAAISRREADWDVVSARIGFGKVKTGTPSS